MRQVRRVRYGIRRVRPRMAPDMAPTNQLTEPLTRGPRNPTSGTQSTRCTDLSSNWTSGWTSRHRGKKFARRPSEPHSMGAKGFGDPDPRPNSMLGRCAACRRPPSRGRLARPRAARSVFLAWCSLERAYCWPVFSPLPWAPKTRFEPVFESRSRFRQVVPAVVAQSHHENPTRRNTHPEVPQKLGGGGVDRGPAVSGEQVDDRWVAVDDRDQFGRRDDRSS